MARELLTVPAERPLPGRLVVRPYVLDHLHRRRRWEARVATGDTQALNLVALLEIAEPIPVAA
ncbi:hypothetical protein [Nocardiopsis salina]|uniref:hypothetical protein n=1 Tax=Nocardiopsis salina TaxID=245836 RepID=UPI000348F224|nr:hypothetical protein [Nocardiopsis salina]